MQPKSQKYTAKGQKTKSQKAKGQKAKGQKAEPIIKRSINRKNQTKMRKIFIFFPQIFFAMPASNAKTVS